MPIIQAVDRALRILDLFDEYERELKITEISQRMGMNKSTIHSLLKTLQLHGYIEQNQENGKYRLGMKLFERGNHVVHGLDIRRIAKKHLLDLTMKTGQTVHLVILNGREGVYIDKVEGKGAVLYSRIGRRVPVHSSAVGKVLAAFAPPETLTAMMNGYEYTPHTANTITDQDRFLLELDRVRQRGYATDNQENEPGIFCVAVPIMDHSGHAVASMSMSSPISGLEDDQFENHLRLLKQTAQNISREMGHGITLARV